MAGSDPLIGVSTAGLRAGGGQAGEAATAAQKVAARLGSSKIGSMMFGDIDDKDTLFTAVSAGFDDWTRCGHDAHTTHTSLDGRARDTAGMGDGLFEDLDAMARAATPAAGAPAAAAGPIVDGMRGR